MAVVELDYGEFRTWYPGITEEFVSDELLEVFWEQAQWWVGNTDSKSLAPYDPDATPPKTLRKALLYYVLCHLATLHMQGVDGPVGRIASASQGSVSTSFDLIRSKSNSEVAQWFMQTKCGANFWAMTASMRLGGRLYATKHYHPWG